MYACIFNIALRFYYDNLNYNLYYMYIFIHHCDSEKERERERLYNVMCSHR